MMSVEMSMMTSESEHSNDASEKLLPRLQTFWGVFVVFGGFFSSACPRKKGGRKRTQEKERNQFWQCFQCGAMQKCINIVDVEKILQNGLNKLASIQPRTNPTKL